jgi:hypothetical protein
MVETDSHLKLLFEHIDMLSINILSSSLKQFYPKY